MTPFRTLRQQLGRFIFRILVICQRDAQGPLLKKTYPPGQH